jgi:hypothetical protein
MRPRQRGSTPPPRRKARLLWDPLFLLLLLLLLLLLGEAQGRLDHRLLKKKNKKFKERLRRWKERKRQRKQARWGSSTLAPTSPGAGSEPQFYPTGRPTSTPSRGPSQAPSTVPTAAPASVRAYYVCVYNNVYIQSQLTNIFSVHFKIQLGAGATLPGLRFRRGLRRGRALRGAPLSGTSSRCALDQRPKHGRGAHGDEHDGRRLLQGMHGQCLHFLVAPIFQLRAG